MQHRRLRCLGGALVVALTIGAVSACGGSSHPGPTPPPLRANVVGPESMFTLGGAVPNPQATLTELQRWGVQRLHVTMPWSAIAPDPLATRRPAFDATNPAAYPAAGWAPFDTLVRGLAQRHMGIDLAVASPVPAWAEAPGSTYDHKQSDWEPNAAEFGQFVTAVATRYSGHYTPPGQTSPLPRVNFWSIWNEPNLGIYLAPETASGSSPVEVAPRLYRGIVDAAWKALQATGHGSDTILIGETAPAGSSFKGALKGDFGVFGLMPPLQFLRALYCVDANYKPLRGTAATERGCPATAAGSAVFAARNPGLFHASGVADHPYPQALPPDMATPNEPDYAELASIPKLERVLDEMQRLYGSSTTFPIWSTEFGYVTDPPNSVLGGVPIKTAAYYLNWAQYITWEDPRIKSYDQYLINDPSSTAGFASGVKFFNGKVKPTLAAYVLPLYLPVQSATKGTPLVVWGQVRPAPYAVARTHRPQTVAIQFAAGSGGAFKTVQQVTLTNANGYFEVHQLFASSGRVRLSWSDLNGRDIVSRTATVTIH